MEQITAPSEIAQTLTTDDATVEYDGTPISDDRHSFSFEGGPVHTHLIPDDYYIVGIGQNWFALKLE